MFYLGYCFYLFCRSNLFTMERYNLGSKLSLSRIIHGHWRLSDWNLSDNELIRFIKQITDLGITSFDTADIYGDYTCEKLFGNALHLDKGVRNNIEIITKCGISLISEKFPSRKEKIYNYNYNYIVEAVNRSLSNLNTEYIDLLLLHRPSPLINPEDVARAFDDLEKSGKVLNFGVSNFTPLQFEMLESYTNQKLVTNQVEISPLHLEHFENGNIDFFLKERIIPMAWSPLTRGRVFNPHTTQEKRVNKTVTEISEEIGTTVDKVLIAWLLHHPAKILPIVGSGNIERIQSIAESIKVSLSDDQWFRIYIASIGKELP